MIRQYKDEDADSLVSVWREASDLAHPFLTKAFQDEEAEKVRSVYPEYAEIWVKELDGEIVGFIAMLDTEVGAIFVRPKHHGKRLGLELMNFAVEECDAQTLDVFKGNVIGRRFYDAYGFRVRSEYLHQPTGQMTLKLTI